MEIECSFEIEYWMSGRLYTGTVKSSSITNPCSEVTSCKGAHQAGKSNADVEWIKFSGVVVKYFPMGLHEIFPNLKALTMHNCGLKEISRRDLKGLENLTTLWLYNNQLKSLPDGLLSGMTKLVSVSFSFNKLEFVSSKLLQPIKNNKLVSVDFGAAIGRFEPGKAGSLGSLQELCEIIDENCKKPIETRQDLAVEDFPERIARGYKEFWTSGRLSDFVIVCGSKEFKVHKLVLAIESSVLAAAVESDMRESKRGRMEIVDFSKEAVEDFLKYLYTGETPGEANAMEILAMASKYDVPALQFLMEKIILDNIDESNAIEVLTMAKQHNCEFLAQAVFNKVQGMFPGTELCPNLMDDPVRLKQLIDAKQVMIDAELEYDRVLNAARSEYEGVLKSCLRIKK